MQEELRDDGDNNNNGDDGEPKCVCFLGHFVKSIRSFFRSNDRSLFSSVTSVDRCTLQLLKASQLLVSMSPQQLEEVQLCIARSPEEFQGLHLLAPATQHHKNRSSATWVKSIRNFFMPEDRNLFSSVTPLEGRMLQLREARYLLASMSLQELQELQLLDPMSPEEFQALHLLSSATRRRENQSSETVLPSDGQTRTLLERSPPESVA